MLIAAIDQGTTSCRCLIFDKLLRVVASHQIEHEQITPNAGWLEHNPKEIYEASLKCIDKAVEQVGDQKSEIAAVGVTNQRETTVLWDKETGEPLHNAVVWSDVRTVETVQKVLTENSQTSKGFLQDKCGLPLSTYFSALKIRWLMDNVEAVQAAIKKGTCLFGTVDSWLIWKLSNGTRHVTDVTNASRTMLMNLNTLQWDDELCKVFGIPRSILPEIRSSSEKLAEISCQSSLKGLPVTACIGDQQSATVGQLAFSPGDVKSTYGTGCFLLLNTGAKPVFSKRGNLTTVCYKVGDQPATFALEGAVANAGSVVQWLRDNLNLIQSAEETETLAEQVDDSGGVFFVPAFSGLYAPHWRSDARGTLTGMTQYTKKHHIVRAALEAVCCMNKEVLEAMILDGEELEPPLAINSFRVDGGMTNNALMMQMQADILGHDVIRAGNLETTAMGAAILAGVCAGTWKLEDLPEVTAKGKPPTTFKADESKKEAQEEHFARWKVAIQKSLDPP
eukprot:TRINITY_DN2792_c0_g1_i1.p2 TRINITY_DN2792_c0_g1~~TRINITY_DN2792_c0_g1_i1.p2  ORF type:complete len:518 (+),score=57.98 TRINITY_DN2792_c0_g1_i1:39-1556(+)